MTPESEGGDLLETIAPHLVRARARVERRRACRINRRQIDRRIAVDPRPMRRRRRALARRSRAFAPAASFARPRPVDDGIVTSGTPRFDFPRGPARGPSWRRSPGRTAPRGSTPALDLAVGDVVVGLNDRAWRLAGFDDADDVATGRSRVRGVQRGHTPRLVERHAFDLATAAVPDARGGFRAGPHEARVGVVASRARGDRAGNRRARPLETKKTPPSRRRTRTVGRRRGGLARGSRRVGGGARGGDARGARVVAAVAVARVGVRRTSGNDGGARVALHAATQCRLRGLADTCALVVAPREAPKRTPERTRRDSYSDRDSSSDRDSIPIGTPIPIGTLRTRIRTRRVQSGTRVSDSDSDSFAGDVAMQAIAASAAGLTSRGEWLRRLRADGVEAERRDRRRRRRRRRRPRLRLRPSRRRGRRPSSSSTGATRRGWAEETAATEAKYAAVRDACVRAMGAAGTRVSCASVALGADRARRGAMAFL